MNNAKNSSLRNKKNLIWIDLEMSGLNPITDVIIEIACVITDKDLNMIDESPSIAIYQDDKILNNMDKWNTNQHAKSGLIARVRESKINEKQAEKIILDFVKKHVAKKTSPMCGNSICQDRRFLANYMPELEKYFHYRHIDVSTLKELAKRWKSEIIKNSNKESSHLALSDIYDSINELKFYRKHFINV